MKRFFTKHPVLCKAYENFATRRREAQLAEEMLRRRMRQLGRLDTP